jgi:predicted DNA-binding protein
MEDVKSVSIKITKELYNQLQLIVMKESVEKNTKVYLKDIILEAIQDYSLPKYDKHIVKKGRKGKVVA